MNALTIKGGDGNELILDDEVLEITTAILLYKHRKISLSGAAKLLGLPVAELMELFTKASVEIDYDLEDFKDDLKTLESLRHS